MGRIIRNHLIPEQACPAEVVCMDRPGEGGACHAYEILVGIKVWKLDFQNGPAAEHGFNGITDESLLAIVIDRLWHFQSGPFACESNRLALGHARDALDALKSRTADRISRGVEGQAKP